MRETLLTRKDDGVGDGPFDSVRWALDVHALIPDTGEYNAAVLHGNEDSPSAIEFYAESEPLITSVAAYRWVSPAQD